MVAVWAVVVGLAFAGGQSSPKPPPPPAVDFSVLPPSASVRPTNGDGKPHQVHARLLVDQATVTPGQPFRVGVHLTQDPGWHTYWRSPGDIGLPTEITWQLPDGTVVEPYAFPVPQRFEQEGIVSFGYDDQVLFFSTVTLPATVPAGEVVVAADARWLVCETSCIPGEVKLSLPVTVGAAAAPGPLAPIFDHYAKQHPVEAVSVADLAVETALNASAFQPESKFQAAFLLTSPTGAAFGPPPAKGTWPVFTPIVGFDWMITETKISAVDGGLLVVLSGETFAPDPLPTADRIGGLFQVELGGKLVQTEITTPVPWVAAGAAVTPSSSPLWALASGQAAAAPVVAAPAEEAQSLPLMLAMALFGGLLLNIMPCVLPVLTLKLYGLVEQADLGAAGRQRAGVAYTAGILASFLALAGAVIALQSTLGAVGWGFQFQWPPYVAALATIVFAFGLSLFGVFEIPAFGEDAAAEASSKDGMAGYFMTGVFATLVATPCSAPFLGTALGFAFSQTAPVILLFFGVIGFGLALPFLVIAFVPALFRLMPQPGEWMITFKQLMGFTLVATTVWLVDVLAAQIGSDRATGFLAFLVAVGLGAWVFGHWGGLAASRGRQLAAGGVGVAIAVGAGVGFLDLRLLEEAECATTDTEVDVASLSFDEHIPWVPFSDAQVASLAGSPVFIDFTADWCLTCKVNERTVLETDTVRAAMAEHGVVPLKADWTRRDPEITAWLQRYGRAGVPFYIVLPSDRSRDAIVLGEVVTPAGVVSALAAAK